MILLLDNFDSFTFNLVDYLNQLGASCDVQRNNIALADLTAKRYSALVISPGPETPVKSGVLMDALHYYHNKIPILGICLGHQAIGQYFGAQLIKATQPKHGKISIINCLEDPVFKEIPNRFNVVRYNSLLLDEVNSPLKTTSYTDDKEVMSIRHETLPICGLQFHPEAALTEHGLQLLKNWLGEMRTIANH